MVITQWAGVFIVYAVCAIVLLPMLHFFLLTQFQKAAMVEFCQQHPETGSMPADEVRQYDLFKHLLYDDEKEVIFCYVPKGRLLLTSHLYV